MENGPKYQEKSGGGWNVETLFDLMQTGFTRPQPFLYCGMRAFQIREVLLK